MVWARRLLSVVLALAIAQFGALAAAPAHAHAAAAHHAVHAIESPAGLTRDAVDRHGHDHGRGHDHFHPAGLDDDAKEDGRADGGAEPVTHIHACAPFTQVAVQAVPVVALVCMRGAWPASYVGPSPHASAPPDRPPRLVL